MAACLQAPPPTWPVRHMRHACCALQAAARQEPGHSGALHATSPRTRQLQGLGEPARPCAALPEPGRGPTAQLLGPEAASSLRGCGDGAQPVARAEATAAPTRQRRLQEAANSVAAEPEQARHNGRSRAWSEADALACRDVLWRALGRRDLRTALQAADAAYAAGAALAPGQADALLQGSPLAPCASRAPVQPLLFFLFHMPVTNPPSPAWMCCGWHAWCVLRAGMCCPV